MGTDPERGGSGDPSPMTAWGVFCGMEACLAHVYGSKGFAGRRVAVQGAGKVGSELVRRLVEAGAEVVVADVAEARAERLKKAYGVATCAPDALYEQACDIFAPCALSGVINAHTLDRLSCRIVAGGANNQLAGAIRAEELRQRDILYVPDYVINAGGLINVASERESFDRAHVEREVISIGGRVAGLLEEAAGGNTTPLAIADERVRAVLKAARDSGHMPHLCPRRPA